MVWIRVLSGLGVAAALCIAAPSFAADSASGRHLAERWCAACHVIDGSTPPAVQDGAPSFRAIARGKLTDAQLRTFLAQPHGGMPDLSLTGREIDDLLSYLATLR